MLRRAGRPVPRRLALDTRWHPRGGVHAWRARRRGPAARRVTGYRPLYPGRDLNERTTSAAALELIPIESLDGALHTDFGEVTPPWRKRVFASPLSNSTS